MIKACSNCKNTGKRNVCKGCINYYEENTKSLWEPIRNRLNRDFNFDIPEKRDRDK